MSHRFTARALVSVCVLALAAACSPTDSTSAKLHPRAAMSISGSTITYAYLAVPAGVTLGIADQSAGGFIFGSGSSNPYVWTAPYASNPTPFSTAGALGGGGGANDLGDARGSSNGPGYWQQSGSDWQFAAVNPGAYTGVTVMGVNNARNIVGYGSLNGRQRALWWSDVSSPPSQLPDPVPAGTITGSFARGVNNVGQVIGYVNDQVVSGRNTVTYEHTLVWSNDGTGWQVTTLKDVGTTNFPYMINDAGQVTANADTYTAVVWTPTSGAYGNGVVVSTNQGGATRIDRCGRVVGYTHTTSASKRRAWVWENGLTTFLPMPTGTIATETAGIMTDATGRGIITGGAMPSGSQNNNTSFLPLIWDIPGCP